MNPYSKRYNNAPIASKKATIALLVSLAVLSLMDAVFNTVGLPKGALFTLTWLFFVGIFALASLQLVKKVKFESNYFKYLFLLFMGYGAVIVFRGLSFSSDALTSYLRVPYIFWPFLIPFLAFLGRNIKTYNYVLQVLFYLSCLFPLLIIAFPGLIASASPAEVLVYSTVLGSGFLLMNSNYISESKINISFIFLVLAALIFLYLARRAGLFMILGLIAASYIFVIFKSKKPLIFKLFPVFLAIAVVVFFQFDTITDTLLAEINKRLYEDTRSTVVDMFYMDMENHFVFGKGINATYYCPIGGGLGESGIDYDIIYYRDVIENGYLQLILSGGLVHVILFLLIVIPAAFNGVFRSSNLFVKSCGAMIFLWMVFMIGAGLPSLSLGYVLVWVSIGVCYRKSLRSKSDEEIRKAFGIIDNSLKTGTINQKSAKR